MIIDMSTYCCFTIFIMKFINFIVKIDCVRIIFFFFNSFFSKELNLLKSVSNIPISASSSHGIISPCLTEPNKVPPIIQYGIPFFLQISLKICNKL